MTRCRRSGVRRFRYCWMRMTDEQIGRLSIPEIIDLIRRLLEEIEVRSMEVVE